MKVKKTATANHEATLVGYPFPYLLVAFFLCPSILSLDILLRARWLLATLG